MLWTTIACLLTACLLDLLADLGHESFTSPHPGENR
jgi:hypothetical protein